MSRDNDPSRISDFRVGLVTASSLLFVMFAKMEERTKCGRSCYLRDGMMEEAKEAKAYLKWEIDIVVERKPEGMKLHVDIEL